MSEQEGKSIRKAYHEDLVILVVEDYMIFSKEVRHALPQHRVILARTVEEARARYEEWLPNITFLDIDLPDGDGFAVLDFIRTVDPDTYVIMLSGSKLQDDITTAQRKKANGYIIKPFTRSRIEQCVEEYLKTRESSIKTLLKDTEKHRLQTQTTQFRNKIVE